MKPNLKTSLSGLSKVKLADIYPNFKIFFHKKTGGNIHPFFE